MGIKQDKFLSIQVIEKTRILFVNPSNYFKYQVLTQNNTVFIKVLKKRKVYTIKQERIQYVIQRPKPSFTFIMYNPKN